jgi:anthranilate synthase component 1
MEPIDLTTFLDLVNSGHNVVPLPATLQLDRETPVSLYHRLGERAIFLLESAALGEATGRYSFIGLDRLWRVSTSSGQTIVDGAFYGDADLSPLETVRQLLGRYNTYTPRTLPDFFGGAVGFVSYDYVRRLERLPRKVNDDMWPDLDFSFPRAVLVCDHVRHSTTVVVNAFVDVDDDPKEVFTEASVRLNEIVATLLASPPASDPASEQLIATAPTRRTTIDVRALAA